MSESPMGGEGGDTTHLLPSVCPPGLSWSLQVVDLLNQAALITNDSKINILKQVSWWPHPAPAGWVFPLPCPHIPTVTLCPQVQELIINKDPTLLDNFLDVSGDGSSGWPGTDPEGCRMDPAQC